MKPGLASFLGRYFSRYVPLAAVAAGAAFVAAASTVSLLVLFRLVLSEVLLTDEAAVDVGVDGPGWMQLDLDALFTSLFRHLENRYGVDESSVVFFLPGLLVAVFFLRGLASFLNGYLFQVIGLGATNRMRNDLYGRLLDQSVSFHARHPTGELLSRVGYDISAMQNAISNQLLELLQQSLTLLGLGWYLVATYSSLALACLGLVPVAFYPIFLFGQGVRRAGRRGQERLADLSSLVVESVHGYKVVQAFTMESFELDRFRLASHRHLRAKLRGQLLTHASAPVVQSLIAIGLTVLLVLAAYRIRAGELRPADLLTFLAALVLFYDPIRKLNKIHLALQEGLAAAERVAGVMAIPNDIEDRPGARTIDRLEQAIRFERVSFAYEDLPVLEEVDFTVRRGEIVALVGPSGAGKSTLIQLLPRFYDPVAGRVTIDGVDVRDVTQESLRAQIGFVTQDTVLFNDTVRNNIAYGRCDLELDKVREAAAAAYADEFISELPEGYDTMIGTGGLRLSGGERQRLAIARALVKDPPILLLDEATSHLDEESERLVREALRNLLADRTALIVAHRLSTVQLASRIVVLDQGRVVDVGTHDQLLDVCSIYQRFYDLQRRDEGRAR